MAKSTEKLATFIRRLFTLLMPVALALILGVAGYLRLTGADWGNLTHQHPDETFIATVTDDISFESGLANYFDSARSLLNPVVHKHSFYVYGTLPIFIVRLAADLLDNVPIRLLGRLASGLFDLGVVLLAYLIAARLYGKVSGLLAAAFSALAVMQIQQSHFYTTDNFANFFTTLAFYAAILLVSDNNHPRTEKKVSFYTREFLFAILFGLAAGAAIASKFNAFAVVVTLPAALLLRLWSDRHPKDTQPVHKLGILPAILMLGLGAVLTFLIFRIANPYSFMGPGFWGLKIDPAWLDSMKRQLEYSRGNTSISWFIQWMHLSRLHPFINLTRWGLGLPLGILAWTGVAFMLWRSIRGEWRLHSLLLGWLILYFSWNSTQATPFMRYQMPSYPLLAVAAAWFVVTLARMKVHLAQREISLQPAGWLVGTVVLAATAVWALAFVSIYQRPEPRIAASEWVFENISPGIVVETASGNSQVVKNNPEFVITPEKPFVTAFRPNSDESGIAVIFGRVEPQEKTSGAITLGIDITTSKYKPSLVTTSTTVSMADLQDSVTIPFDTPIALEANHTYLLTITSSAPVTVRGEVYANETSSDYWLPFGAVQSPTKKFLEPSLNLDVYKNDSPEKYAELLTALDKTDYILLPTNHQYGQISRVPERYPLMNLYYRELLGCPQDEKIPDCYAKAVPGTYQGRLGFDLVAVFSSYPELGQLTINDQLAEESFTFYDHPKVMIFKKNADYDASKVAEILSNVDYTNIITLTIRQSRNFKSTLLSQEKWAEQRAGGTWSEIFNSSAPQNRYPAVAVLVWYLFILLLGLGTYPITRMVFGGLSDRGYPISRTFGLLLLSWLAWFSASSALPYTRTVIFILLVAMLGFSAFLAYRQRKNIQEEFSNNKKYYLLIEIFFLVLFLLDLWIRIQNPDLWHASKGGERPMDFSYLNAILKSTSFPPYDPWYAGGYINYYYYGFVLVGTPIKLLGIMPSLAYNLVLPTLFALVGMGAFSVAWNLAGGSWRTKLTAGVFAALGMILLGNLATVRMIWEGLISLGKPAGLSLDDIPNLLTRFQFATKGFQAFIGGQDLPIRPSSWYWDPSRAIPAPAGDVTPITEFPLFTFIYSDLHAHMMALPLALGALGWSLSTLRMRFSRERLGQVALSLFGGALLVGALLPTNTWDLPLYLLLGGMAVGFAIWHSTPDTFKWWQRAGLALLGAGGFAALALMLFTPYRQSFFSNYGSLSLWTKSKSELKPFLVHWGFFLFMILSWMAYETAHNWKEGFDKFKNTRFAPDVTIIAFWVGLSLAYFGTPIAVVASPAILWAGILFFLFPLRLEKRIALLIFAGCMTITLFVEYFVLAGDIGRMNTVFKFYLQAWTLLAVLTGASIGWIMEGFASWRLPLRIVWAVAAILMLTGASLFLFTGVRAKIADRMEPVGPKGLDATAFMLTGIKDESAPIPLAEDYRAIRWLQENIKGSPVIAEMQMDEYHLGSRISMYTGLPDVVGWRTHQRQQRALLSGLVDERIDDVRKFYDTADAEWARNFLKKYQVEYFIVGLLERADSDPAGLDKFTEKDGAYWESVYEDGGTVIYRVINK